MINGNWVSGHSDNYIDGNTNKCNTTKSNMNLYLLDNPTFDPNFSKNVPALLNWTETNMVAVATSDGLYGTTGQYYGAHVPAEQTAYMWRMGYQSITAGGRICQMVCHFRKCDTQRHRLPWIQLFDVHDEIYR